MGERVFTLEVVHIIGADELEAELLCQGRGFLPNRLLPVDPVILDLDIEIFAKNLLVNLRGSIRLRIVPGSQVSGHHASCAGRKSDQSVPVLP